MTATWCGMSSLNLSHLLSALHVRGCLEMETSIASGQLRLPGRINKVWWTQNVGETPDVLFCSCMRAWSKLPLLIVSVGIVLRYKDPGEAISLRLGSCGGRRDGEAVASKPVWAALVKNVAFERSRSDSPSSELSFGTLDYIDPWAQLLAGTRVYLKRGLTFASLARVSFTLLYKVSPSRRLKIDSSPLGEFGYSRVGDLV